MIVSSETCKEISPADCNNKTRSARKESIVSERKRRKKGGENNGFRDIRSGAVLTFALGYAPNGRMLRRENAKVNSISFIRRNWMKFLIDVGTIRFPPLRESFTFARTSSRTRYAPQVRAVYRRPLLLVKNLKKLQSCVTA